MKIPFQGDAIAAVEDGPNEIRADDFLIQTFATAADVAINHFVGVTLVGPDFFERLTINFMLLLLPLDSFLAFGADGHARSGHRIIYDKFVDDDSIHERGF